MPRADVSVSAVRNPARLTSILNDYQRQLSACRLRIKALEEKTTRKPRKKRKKTQPKQLTKPVETEQKEPENANGTA